MDNEIPITDDDYKAYERGLNEIGVKILEKNDTSLLVDVTDLIDNIKIKGFTIND